MCIIREGRVVLREIDVDISVLVKLISVLVVVFMGRCSLYNIQVRCYVYGS